MKCLYCDPLAQGGPVDHADAVAIAGNVFFGRDDHVDRDADAVQVAVNLLFQAPAVRRAAYDSIDLP